MDKFKLQDITAYQISSELSDYVYKIVEKWSIFAQKALGNQWTRSTDSISGNIAEGFGRFHKKDKVKFYYNARASAFEAAHWVKRSYARKLITEEQYSYIIGELRKLPKEINMIIKLTMENLKY